MLGHCVWFSDSEFARAHERDASIAHCPTSNLFLGSGLFRLLVAKEEKRPIHVGLGTDIGAGTIFSLLQTINEAYKIAALNAAPITAFEALYLATLGGARSLGLEDRIGSLRVGREADIVVLDPRATPLLSIREALAVAGGNPVRADDPWRRPRRARHLCAGGACPCTRPG
jgi:guanine deaminase